MATPSQDDLVLLLVGKVGVGKSSTGNSILGRMSFKTGMVPLNRACQKEVAKVQGHNVVVVDSPSLTDAEAGTGKYLTKLRDETANTLGSQPCAFDAMLIVLQYGRRFTEEDRLLFEQIEAAFGKDYTKYHGILVVTHVDMYFPEENNNMTIENFLKAQTGLIREMLAKCNNRVVWFNNRAKEDSVRQKQVKSLIDLVTQMRHGFGYSTSGPSEDAMSSRVTGHESHKTQGDSTELVEEEGREGTVTDRLLTQFRNKKAKMCAVGACAGGLLLATSVSPVAGVALVVASGAAYFCDKNK